MSIYTLNDILPFEDRLIFFLGSTGSGISYFFISFLHWLFFTCCLGKTTFFRDVLLPQLLSTKKIYVKTRDVRDFEECSSVEFLDADFQLTDEALQKIPSGSVIFYGKLDNLYFNQNRTKSIHIFSL